MRITRKWFTPQTTRLLTSGLNSNISWSPVRKSSFGNSCMFSQTSSTYSIGSIWQRGNCSQWWTRKVKLHLIRQHMNIWTLTCSWYWNSFASIFWISSYILNAGTNRLKCYPLSIPDRSSDVTTSTHHQAAYEKQQKQKWWSWKYINEQTNKQKHQLNLPVFIIIQLFWQFVLYICVALCNCVCVSDSAFAAVRVSAASSGTGTPGESPVKDHRHTRALRNHLHVRFVDNANCLFCGTNDGG